LPSVRARLTHNSDSSIVFCIQRFNTASPNLPVYMPSLPQLHTEPDLVERVYEALLEGICNGQLAPGEKFTQALLLLRQQGLIVDTENRRGVRVAALEPAFVSGLYAVRAALDALAARAAANRPRPELKTPGLDIIRRGRKASADGDLAALVKLDLEFHRFLYEAADNPVLVDSAQLNWHHTRRVMAAYLRQPVSLRGVWAEHLAILNAVVKGDAKLAEKLSRIHAEQSVRLLFASLAGHQATHSPPVTHNPSVTHSPPIVHSAPANQGQAATYGRLPPSSVKQQAALAASQAASAAPSTIATRRLRS
jgi:DNA-binding GntR family transcriptional regulator